MVLRQSPLSEGLAAVTQLTVVVPDRHEMFSMLPLHPGYGPAHLGADCDVTAIDGVHQTPRGGEGAHIVPGGKLYERWRTDLPGNGIGLRELAGGMCVQVAMTHTSVLRARAVRACDSLLDILLLIVIIVFVVRWCRWGAHLRAGESR